ncbi:MAG: dTDP-4-dehydrorhamnose reductase [Alphaproteobacteria bacterium]|nr:dTDP-4-dehydrorhamnose reductase [Alphaproteobacteria bacterium]
MARLLVLGRSGQLARALAEGLPRADRHVVCLGRPELDLADAGSLERAMAAVKPDVVINAAAYTAVDKAEDDAASAHAINADGAGAAARAAAAIGARFVHFSTDYVFDGAKGAPYVESDAPAPANVYGASKLAGERAVMAHNASCVIVRTSWVYAPYGANFVQTMLRLASSNDVLRVVDDQRGAPTYAPDIADAVSAIVDRLAAPHGEHAFGVFHYTGAGDTTWHGFAQAIMDGARARGQASCPVEPITTAQYPTRARRPADSRLDAQKIAAAYGVRAPDWRVSLDRCLDRLMAT